MKIALPDFLLDDMVIQLVQMMSWQELMCSLLCDCPVWESILHARQADEWMHKSGSCDTNCPNCQMVLSDRKVPYGWRMWYQIMIREQGQVLTL